MNRWRGSFFLVGALITFPLLPAASGSPTALESATVSELKNEVSYQAADGSERAAKVEDVVQGREAVKTGGGSMVELEFADGTLARLGSHSALAFVPESREVQTRSGLSVFFIPKGMGGLRIMTHAVVGAVEGCTVVVEEIERPQGASAQHWTKFLLVEGSRASVSLPNGKPTSSLRAGQGIFQREGASTLSLPFDFDVKALTEKATIFTGFHRAWPGLDDINAVIEKQSRALNDGRMVHAVYYWTGRGTQQGTLPSQFPVPELPGMVTPPYNDSGSRGGLLLYEFDNIAGANQPTPSSIK
ncbi:MAG: hypothetical protein ACLP0A_12400 [Verrucomicrobiia bacterium]